MQADIAPMEILLVLSVELLFGVGYNALVAWAHFHKIWHVSVSVAIGVTITLLLPVAVWFDREMVFAQAGMLLAACFTASGIPMIVGSARRTVQEKDQKKRRPWPTAAMRIRDNVVMELASMAHEIAEKAKNQELTVSDLPDYVNRLHGIIGTLKSV